MSNNSSSNSSINDKKPQPQELYYHSYCYMELLYTVYVNFVFISIVPTALRKINWEPTSTRP